MTIGKRLSPTLSEIEDVLLEFSEIKPEFTEKGFKACIFIFQTALMDKMYDNQEYDKMSIEDRSNMAVKCGLDLRKLIHAYTGLDTHQIEKFL